jgi:hypothetical protein
MNFDKSPQSNEQIEKTFACELEKLDDFLDITFKNVKLSDEGNKTLGRLVVDVEKLPLIVSETGIIGMIKFGEENETTKELIGLAESLSTIEDERQRIDELLAVLKSKITYGYLEVIESKAQEHNVSLEFMQRMGVQGNNQIGFDEVAKYGVGVCGHLSSVYLYLANKAGLKGILVNSAPERTPINIARTDRDKKLFRSAEVGSRTSNHAWVEIQVQDGTWIPVDPSTELTGTTEEGMSMFREADYVTSLGSLLELSFDESTSIGSQGSTDENSGIVPTGQKGFRKDFKIGLKDRLSFGGKKLEPRVIEKEEVKGRLQSSGYSGNVKIISASFDAQK